MAAAAIDVLIRHVEKHYSKHGRVVAVESGTNLLGERTFRTVKFLDGYRATFQYSARRLGDHNINPWFRNERH
jgi:hypothetical protein